jgi:hypothetical protein
MIPLSDLISRVRTKYEQSSNVRWSDDDITSAINEGLQSLAEGTGFYERYVTIPLAQPRQWYDVRGFTPEVVVHIKSIHNSNRNLWLKPVSTEELPYNWEQSVGEPQYFFTRGIHWFGVWPRPEANNAGWLRVYFAGIPQDFTFGQQVLRDLPDNHLPALEDYALYELSAQDRETARAIQHYRSYLKREKDLQDFIDGRRVDSTAGRLYTHERHRM